MNHSRNREFVDLTVSRNAGDLIFQSNVKTTLTVLICVSDPSSAPFTLSNKNIQKIPTPKNFMKASAVNT